MRHSQVERDLGRECKAAADLLCEIQPEDDDYRHDIVEGETDLLEAIAKALDEIDECDVITAGCKAKIEELGKRVTAVCKRAERIRAAIEQAMCVAEMETARLPTATVSVKRIPPKPIVDNEAAIPAAYWKSQAPKLDMKAIREAIKSDPIPGVTMDNGGISLQIRRL